jgi:hypothetical protein
MKWGDTEMTSQEGVRWHSVETPSLFEEIALPEDDSNWNRFHKRQWGKLQRLAEEYGTHITSTSYRKG